MNLTPKQLMQMLVAAADGGFAMSEKGWNGERPPRAGTAGMTELKRKSAEVAQRVYDHRANFLPKPRRGVE